MSITTIDKDLDQLTMTVTAEYDVTPERAWQLWADPRQLERWWGPPTHPATVQEHDLTPGGRVTYFMTSPEGERYHGWWGVREVEAPRLLVVEDGFADSAGVPNPEMPTSVMRVEILDRPGGVRVVISSRWPTLEAMEQVIAMGVEEGLRGAMGQIDEILAGSTV